nr:MAG TPA: hypothetical protein [Caudoviricetes sp.]
MWRNSQPAALITGWHMCHNIGVGGTNPLHQTKEKPK